MVGIAVPIVCFAICKVYQDFDFFVEGCLVDRIEGLRKKKIRNLTENQREELKISSIACNGKGTE